MAKAVEAVAQRSQTATAVYTTPANGFSFALPTATAGGSDRLRVGYTIGGGIEWMVRPNWSIKTEYGYYNLGTANYSAGRWDRHARLRLP